MQKWKYRSDPREAIYHAQLHAFAHRKDKKNDFRSLWISRLNAALKLNGLRYSKFINTLQEKNIKLDRKVMSTLAKDRPGVFSRIILELR